MSAALVAVLEQAFDAELRKLDGVSVVSSAEMVLVLGNERQKQLLGGNPADSLSDLLTGVDASDVVAVDVAAAGPGYVINARRLARDGHLVNASKLEVGSDPTELVRAAAPIVPALFPELKRRLPAASATPTSTRPIRVAVLEVRSVGEIPARALAALNQSVTPELRKLDGVSAIASSELADMLGMERQKQLMGCTEASTSCMEELAGALDADELVALDLTLVGEAYALTARRTDLRKSKVVQTQLKQFDRRDGEELLAVIGPTIEALYPDRPLKAGRSRGVEAQLIRRLNPPPLPRWIFFGTAGAAAVTAAGGGVFAYLMLDAQKDFNALAQRSVTEPVRGADLNALRAKTQANTTNANVLFATASAVALIAVVEIFFTDWRDDRAAFSAQPLALAGGGGGLQVTWTQW